MNLFPVILQVDNRIIPYRENLIRILADLDPKYPASKYYMGVIAAPFFGL